MAVQFTVDGQDAGAISFLEKMASKFSSTGKAADTASGQFQQLGQTTQRLAGPANALASAMGNVGGGVVSAGLAMAAQGPHALAFGAAVGAITLVVREFNKAAEEKAKHYESLAKPRELATAGIKAQTAALRDLLEARRANAAGVPAEVQAQEKQNRAVKDAIDLLKERIRIGEAENRARAAGISGRERIIAGVRQKAGIGGEGASLEDQLAAQTAAKERDAMLFAATKQNAELKRLRRELQQFETEAAKTAVAEEVRARQDGAAKWLKDGIDKVNSLIKARSEAAEKERKETEAAENKRKQLAADKRRADDEEHTRRMRMHQERMREIDAKEKAEKQAAKDRARRLLAEMTGQPEEGGGAPAAARAAGGGGPFAAMFGALGAGGLGALGGGMMAGGMQNPFAQAFGGAAGGGGAGDPFADINAQAGGRDARRQARRNIANEIDLRRVDARIGGGDEEEIVREGRRRRAAAGRGEGADFANAQQEAFAKGVEEQAAKKGVDAAMVDTLKEMGNAWQELKAEHDKTKQELGALKQFINGGRKAAQGARK